MWHHPVFSGLQSLSLSNLPSFGPSVFDLLSILDRCNNIHTLLLSDTRLYLCGRPLNSGLLISLPKLRNLSLLEVSHEPFFALMEHIQPQLEMEMAGEFKYHFHFDDTLIPMLPPPLLPRHVLPLLPERQGELNIVFGVGAIRLEISTESCVGVNMREPGVKFTFDVHEDDEWEPYISPLADLVQSSNLNSIPMKTITSTDVAWAFVRVFFRQPRLSRLNRIRQRTAICIRTLG